MKIPEVFTKDELAFVKELTNRDYIDNSMTTNSTTQEKVEFDVIKKKLKYWAEYISFKYTEQYGTFEVCYPTGNPIQYNTKNLKTLWSGIFRGSENKQYGVQISIVINTSMECLDIGFYFGSAAGHDLNFEQREVYENNLKLLGKKLVQAINSNDSIQSNFTNLFNFDYHCYINHYTKVSSKEWLTTISENPAKANIKSFIYPDEDGLIDYDFVDSYVSQLLFIMKAFDLGMDNHNKILPPLTPKQWAKQAERLAIIGLNGEKYILEIEKEKLVRAGISSSEYPRHVALESNHYGYDILSLDVNTKKEIFIEVKTTTQDKHIGNEFYLSNNEYQTYIDNKEQYFVYRVYNIDLKPNYEIIDFDSIEMTPNGYSCFVK